MIQQQIPKTNYDIGRGSYRPEFICCHITDGPIGSAEQAFADPTYKKSAHYLIKRNGTIIQFVQEKDVSFGCGIVNRPTATIIVAGRNPNLTAINIEHESQNQDITEEQYKLSAQLIKEICDRWLIPLDRKHIIGHHEIRADKVCPLPISVDKILSLALILKQTDIISKQVNEVVSSPAYTIPQKVGLMGVLVSLLQAIKSYFQ